MNILQVIPIMDPNNLWTGPHRVVFDISRGLARKGHNVTVCTSDMINIRTRITRHSEDISNDFEIVRIKNVSTHLSNMLGLLITPELRNFLSEHIQDFDLVHTHEYTTYQNVIVHKFAKGYGIPYILQAHGSIPRIGKTFRKWLYDVAVGHKILQDASKVIALTKVEAEQYRNIGVLDEKITTIPNGIDLSAYANLPPGGIFKKKFGIPESKKIILYLGRIHKTKGIDFLIRAYSHLIRDLKCNDVVLVIAGPDDGYLREARRLSDSLGISDSVLFTGFVPSEVKNMALVDAEVFVTPSFSGFPMTFLESCLAGTPVITTTLGDDLAWIDGNVGYVTSPTHLDLAKAVYKVVSNEDLRQRLSTNCRNTVKEFSLDKIVGKLEQVYRNCF